MKATHIMRYTSGGGAQYYGGKWNIKETKKSFTFTNIEEPFYGTVCPGKMQIKKEKERKHALRDWGDNTYTVYPYQNGTPHYFEPL